MNKKSYRLIFSQSRGMLIAVAENVVGRGKGSTRAGASRTSKINTVLKLFPLKATSLGACLILGYALQVIQAQTLPTGGKVVGGTASIAQPSSNKMVVTQTTEKAAINWNTLNVGSGDTLQFVQPSANAQVLNRVVGVSGSSQILGNVTANGQVYIVNPQGVVFGNGASVNVGSILASTRDISPNAFMAGGPLEFSAGANASGLISNEGSITAAAGVIVLAADQIRNTGTLKAPNGQVVLAAGDQATLSLSNGQLVQFTVNATANNLSITNSGVIQAQEGKIVLNANATNNLLNAVINLSGVVSAQGGTVAIDSGPAGSANLNGATVDVSRQGGPAGNITVSAKDIQVAANAKLSASSNNSKGGKVVLAGNTARGNSQVTVVDSAINVSGVSSGNVSDAASKGGTVILSGNRVGVLGNSTIDASGVGGGGAVIIGGDQLGKVGVLMPVPLADQTYIGGNATILIGSRAGDGGFVETSGQALTMLGNVRGSSKGKNGEWLIDPTNITINSANSTNVTNASNVWSGNDTATGTVLNTSITDALANGTNVTVTTVSNGTATGTLTVAANLIVNSTQNSTLTLFANQSLTFGAFNVCATGTGTLGLNATAANGTLTVNGTSFNLNGGTANLSGNASTVNSVSIIGNVAFNGNDRIDITGSSVGGFQGVYQTGNLTQVNGITNIVGGNRDGSGNGVWIAGNITQNNGALNIAGTNTNSTGLGVRFNGTNATTGLAYLNQTGGSINITGNSMNTNTNSHGVHLNYVSLNQTSGTLNITGNSNAANALLISNSFLTINSSLNLTGTSNTSLGVSLSNTNVIQNNGSINITGNSNGAEGVLYTGNITQNITQNNGVLNIIGTRNIATAILRGAVDLRGNITQNNGYINVTGVSGTGHGMYSENMNLAQNGGSIFLNGTTNTSGDGFKFYNSNITQNNGNISLIGQTQDVFYDGGFLPVTTIIQDNGSMNIVGSGGGGLRLANVIQNNGSLNIAGNGTAARSGITLNGNLSQTNGTLNITGTSNYSNGVSIGIQTALGTNNTYNTTTGLWTNVTTVVNTTNTSNYSTFTNGDLTNTTALGAFNLTVANGNNLFINGNSINGTGIEVAGLSNLNITAGTLVLNGSISSSQGSGVRLSASQTNTTRVVTTGANTTTTTTNQSNATTLNLLGAGNVTFVGSSASGAGVYLAGGNVTLNNAGTGSLNLNGNSTTGRGVQLGGVTQTTNTNTSVVNSTAGGSNTTTNSSTQIGPDLNLIVAGSGSGPSLAGTSASGIGAYLGNVTFTGTALNISGSSNTGAGVQVGGLNSTLAMPTTAVSNSSTNTVSGTVTTNTATNVSLVADITGNLTLNDVNLSLTGVSNSSGNGVSLSGNLTQNNGTLNIAGTNANGTGSGVQINGNITQNSGNFNVSTIVGNLNQSASNISIANNIQLLAGTGSTAGNTGGGNVTLGSNINVSNNGTLTIFSGDPNTAALQANITGANSTGTYYKTYNAGMVNVSPVSGSQNFYYRSAPSLSVTTNNKVYDTTTVASGVVSGAVDGDIYRASGLVFNNAGAGVQSVNADALVLTNENSAQWSISGYANGNVSTSAVISKANVTLADASANNKVYDSTTNASISNNGSATVMLGNSTLADGSLNSSSSFTNYNVTGSFANASAGTQTVNLTTALADTTNFTLSGASQTNTTAVISKANVTLNVAGTVSDKPYDGTTSATVTNNSSGVVQLGNATAANGSLASDSAFSSSGVGTTGVFDDFMPGLRVVNLANVLLDTANFTLVSGSTLTTSAEILPTSNSQTVKSASVSTAYILQGSTTSGSGGQSTSSATTSSSASTSASSSSQGSSGSSSSEDKNNASSGTGSESVTTSATPGGDIPIPLAPLIALTE